MNRRKGYILILTILVMSAIFFISIMFLGFFRSEHRLALKVQNDNIAAAAANAGIQDSLLQLKQNSTWTGGFDKITLPHSGASYTVTFDNTQTETPYSTNNTNGTATITGYKGRQVFPGMVHMVSQGQYGQSTRTEEALISLSTGGLFDTAVFVDGNITMHGNVMVDSFDSRIGDYNSSHANSNGNIGTNSWSDGIVTMTGNVDIHGNVGVGPDGTEGSSIHTTGQTTYQTFSADPQKLLPFITPTMTNLLGTIEPKGKNSVNPVPGLYSALSVGSQATVTLSTGTYVILGDMDTQGQGQIIIPQGEKVELYILGNISLSGNSIVNGNNDATSFIVYGGPNTTSVRLNGVAEATMAIYAPAADFRLVGNAEIFGALVGKTLTSNGNAEIHYDQALGELGGGGGGGLKVLSRW